MSTDWKLEIFERILGDTIQLADDTNKGIETFLSEYLNDDEERDIFIKYFKEGLNFSKISHLTGYSAGTIRLRMHKIFRIMCHIETRPYDLIKYGFYEANLREVNRHSVSNIDYLRIDQVGFSPRVYNCLKRCNRIEKFSDLEKYTKEDLLKIRNLGIRSIPEIENKMQEYGLSLSKSKKRKIKGRHYCLPFIFYLFWMI